MRYSVELRDRTNVKRYGFLSFAKNMGKNLSNKYGQKLLDRAEKSTTDAIKTASKRAIQETEEANGNLIRNKIADKTTNASRKLLSKKYLSRFQNDNDANNETEPPKKDTYLQKKDSKLN